MFPRLRRELLDLLVLFFRPRGDGLTIMKCLCAFLGLVGALGATVLGQSQASTGEQAGSATAIRPSTFTVPGAFPTSVYTKYYNSPTATDVQVQPVISDPVSVSSALIR